MAALTNDIYVGSVNAPLYHFENPRLEMGSTKGIFSLDVIGNELSIDTYTVTVRWTEDDLYDGFITADDEEFLTVNDEDFMVLYNDRYSPELKNFMRELPFGTPVWWYVDGAFYTKGYLKSVDRVAKYGFKLTCVSGVGLVDTDMHVGGLYQATPITTVLASIIGGAFTYTVSNAVQSVYVYGRLPYDTRRNNLHRLLFATGAALQKGDDETDYVIDFLSEDITDVPASRVSLQGSVDYQLPSNRVEVTEHAFFYLASSPTETLFDNTSETAADHLTVIFDTPVYVASLATTGTLTVNESGVNYAVVSGIGTLTGKYYVHTTQIDVLENNPNNEPIRVRRVTENELITALNARNVQRRLLSYYQSAKTVKAKILTDGERCGQLIRMTDSFGDITQAYLARMDTLVTSVIGASCQLVEGFRPGASGNNFLHRQAITASGTWTVPAGVTFVRIALIGGGTGGQGGYDGEKGKNGRASTSIIDPGWPDYALTPGTYYDDQGNAVFVYAYAYGNQDAAQGGAAGNPGTQGKVYVIEHTVTPGEVITFVIGKGGAGGARNGGAGAAGTATSVSSTSIGTASSDSGLVAQGYFDPFNGDIYAIAGTAGIKGGDGGKTDTGSLYGNNGTAGLKGGDCGIFKGGAGGAGFKVGESYHRPEWGSGGGGGGAAYGANGSPGGAATGETPGYRDTVTTGTGGAGANATAPEKPSYGCAGNGGNGGGGGGNVGGGRMVGTDWTPAFSLYLGDGGAGGKGSKGGAGGDGIGIIYY